MIEKKSIVFYKDWFDVIGRQRQEVQLEIYQAIFEYAFNGVSTDLKPKSEMAMDFIKPQLDRDLEAENNYNTLKSIIGNKREFHWNWKGGKSNKSKLLRNSKEMKIWRKCVFERDRYTCNHCKKVGGKLNAHHIKPFSLYPDLRFDVNNGMTLCKNCHDILHKTEREWEKRAL